MVDRVTLVVVLDDAAAEAGESELGDSGGFKCCPTGLGARAMLLRKTGTAAVGLVSIMLRSKKSLSRVKSPPKFRLSVGSIETALLLQSDEPPNDPQLPCVEPDEQSFPSIVSHPSSIENGRGVAAASASSKSYFTVYWLAGGVMSLMWGSRGVRGNSGLAAKCASIVQRSAVSSATLISTASAEM